MTVKFGTSTDDVAGLMLHLDASDRKSFNGKYSLINMNDWVLGSGGTAKFPGNGLTSENERITATDPQGYSRTIWETRPSGNGDADGGWNGSSFVVDPTKTYRYSVWVKRTVVANINLNPGYVYLGCGANAVTLLGSSTPNINPYFWISQYNQLALNTWYLVVGHIFPSSYTGTNNHPDTGVYLQNGTRVDIPWQQANTDMKHVAGQTSNMHRAYHYYSTDSTARVQFYNPRVDLIDGNQPSIGDLLVGEYSWNDLSGKRNHGVYFGSSARAATLPVMDGTSYYQISNSASWMNFNNAQTIIAWIKPSSVATRQNFYHQAYAGAGSLTYEPAANINYYFGSLGTDSGSNPTDYVNVVSQAGSFPTGSYSMVASVRTKTTIKISKNAQNWLSIGHSKTAVSGTNPIKIGAGYVNPFVGEIVKVMVFDRALSDQEVTDIYNKTKGRFGL